MKNRSYIMFLTLVATLGGLLFGYDTAVISGTVKYLDANFIVPKMLDEVSANSLLGFAVSSALIGCILGGILGGFISTKLGVKRSMMVAALLFVISAFGSAFPEFGFGGEEQHTYLTSFIIYRLLGGIGVGLASMLSPMYIAEMAPADKRGQLVSCNQMAIVFGMLVSYFVNYMIAGMGDEVWLTETGWRMMFLSEVFPAALFFILVFFIPESPRWLVVNNMDQKALPILEKISVNDPQSELQTIKKSVAKNEKTGLLAYGIGIIVIGILLAMFQQFVGINVVLYYAPEIFRNMGSGTDGAMLQTVSVGVINVSFTLLAIFTVDRFGRKPLLIIGSLLMAFSMTGLGLAFFMKGSGGVALTFMLLYVAAFAMSWGPVCWVLLSEIFPNKIRGQALSVATAMLWISNYIVSWTFPMMDRSTKLNELFNGGFAYWVYGAIALISMFFVWKVIPETKGKTLEDMDSIIK